METEPYRRAPDEIVVRRKAEELIGDIMQQAIDNELEVTKRNFAILREHMDRLALENGGVVPIEQLHDLLDQFLRAEI